jgi:hypothetical protein
MSALLVVLAAFAAADVPATESSVAIVISSRRDPSGLLSAEVANALKKYLGAHGIATLSPDEATARLAKLGSVDPKACDGARLCLSKLAQLLGARGAVIGLDVGKAGRFNAGHFECVSAGSVESLAVADITGDAKRWAATSDDALKTFVAELAPKLKTLLAEPVATATAAVTPSTASPDAPVTVKLIPGAPPAPPMVTAEVSKPWGPAVYATGGAAIVSAGVAATFLALALGHKGTFDGSMQSVGGRTGGSSLSQTQLSELSGAANREFTIAAAAGAATGALTAATVFFITRDN